MRRAVEPEPSTRTAGSPSTSAGQATSRSGLRRLVPAASLNRSSPSTGGTRRTGVTEPARHHAADVESSWATSQPSPSGAMAEAAVTGVPSSKYSARTSSSEMSTAPPCPDTPRPARDTRSIAVSSLVGARVDLHHDARRDPRRGAAGAVTGTGRPPGPQLTGALVLTRPPTGTDDHRQATTRHR